MIFREYTIISRARLVIVSDDYTCNIYIYISISYKNRKGGGGGGRERLISKNSPQYKRIFQVALWHAIIVKMKFSLHKNMGKEIQNCDIVLM